MRTAWRTQLNLGARVSGATLLAGSLAFAGLAAFPVAGNAVVLPANEQVVETESSDACQVVSARLNWGVKESFRSYISGSIANGEWVTDNGAGYETPEFFWESEDGELTSDLSGGAVSFQGGVHFTGHDGALQMDLANPTIEFVDRESAYLLLDFGATDTAQEGAPTSAQLRAAKIELGSSLEASGSNLVVSGAPARLTSEGAAAFNGEYGDYAAGDEMDPVSLEATVSGCEFGVVEQPADDAAQSAGESSATAEPVDTAPASAEQQIPWIPIVIGGVAILVIGVTAGMLIAGRTRPEQAQQTQQDEANTPADPEI